MAVLLWGLLGLLAVAVVLLILLLATPVYLRFLAERKPGTSLRFSAEVRLIGGLAPPLRIRGGDGQQPEAAEASEAEAPPPEAPKRPPRRRRRGFPGGKGAGRRMIAALPRLVRGELSRIHIDRLAVDADFGLRDPADTGQLFGWFTPLIYGVRARRIDLALRPDFTGPRLSGRAEAALHLTPGALLWPMIRFFWAVFVVRR